MPSSPRLTPGQQLVDFKTDLASDSLASSVGPKWNCGIITVKVPPQPVAPTSKSNKSAPAVQAKPQDPLIRGNTVASYWALCREVRPDMVPCSRRPLELTLSLRSFPL